MYKIPIYLRHRQEPLIFVCDNSTEAEESVARFDSDFCAAASGDSVFVSDRIRTVGFAKGHVDFFEVPSVENTDDDDDGDYEDEEGEPPPDDAESRQTDVESDHDLDSSLELDRAMAKIISGRRLG